MSDSTKDQTKAASPEQLLLDLTRDPALSRDDLVATPANQAAIALIDSWPNWSSPVAVIHGAEGSGKSHLAAIWRDRTSASITSAGAIGSEAIEAAMRGGAVLVEDVDSVKPDQAGLFHLINAVRQGGSFLLLTSRATPANWPISLPDLVSRLRSAALASIAPPDDRLLDAVLVKLFSDRQISIDPAITAYLVPRMERSLSVARALVEAIDRQAMTNRSAVTRPLAANVLNRLQQSDGEEPDAD
ncbi:hypothetical protein [Notoacmeibacter sp. MSK16QG-6]|uniref:hypothetical protein n=1 Tax=Notoacmeibacter sp. MSK16QG-6 TaxID=2957982 RepID=UPI00209FDDDC|nr:hypothetical protein [Notoacmeibacter sp. MSK16QG-6]MCP1197950.1 hypothetical protein [Notoacmeibacter sp. MSK16QG-6]